VNALMISPLAKGLFHKAIVQSGGGRRRPDLDAAHPASRRRRTVRRTLGVAFATKAGMRPGSRGAMALRAR
jgi:para-nitrobenzyl esterase